MEAGSEEPRSSLTGPALLACNLRAQSDFTLWVWVVNSRLLSRKSGGWGWRCWAFLRVCWRFLFSLRRCGGFVFLHDMRETDIGGRVTKYSFLVGSLLGFLVRSPLLSPCLVGEGGGAGFTFGDGRSRAGEKGSFLRAVPLPGLV